MRKNKNIERLEDIIEEKSSKVNVVEECPSFPTNWKGYLVKVKGKFHCHKCGNKWNSMRTMIESVLLKRDQEVFIRKIYRQKCQKCSSKKWWNPSIYTSELQRCADMILERMNKTSRNKNKAKEGDMKSPHNSSLCEACKNGVCKQNQSSNVYDSDCSNDDSDYDSNDDSDYDSNNDSDSDYY